MSNKLFVAFTSPASADVEDAYNDWYNTQHVPDLVDIPGIVSGQRYKLSDATASALAGFANGHQYCVVYQVDGEPDQIMKEIGERAADGRIRLTPGLMGADPAAVILWLDAI
jgi:hypothetical protein